MLEIDKRRVWCYMFLVHVCMIDGFGKKWFPTFSQQMGEVKHAEGCTARIRQHKCSKVVSNNQCSQNSQIMLFSLSHIFPS